MRQAVPQGIRLFFMHSPMQKKCAAKAAHFFCMGCAGREDAFPAQLCMRIKRKNAKEKHIRKLSESFSGRHSGAVSDGLYKIHKERFFKRK